MHTTFRPPGPRPDDLVEGTQQAPDVPSLPLSPIVDPGFIRIHRLDKFIFLHRSNSLILCRVLGSWIKPTQKVIESTSGHLRFNTPSLRRGCSCYSSSLTRRKERSTVVWSHLLNSGGRR